MENQYLKNMTAKIVQNALIFAKEHYIKGEINDKIYKQNIKYIKKI